MPERELDIVLYGATGFVGALTAAHLAQHAGPGVRIALAGRSRPKLEALRIELGPAALVVGARRRRRDRRPGPARARRAHPRARHDGRPVRDVRQGGRAGLRRGGDALRRPDRGGALRPLVARRARRPGRARPGRPSCTPAASTPSRPTSACSPRPGASPPTARAPWPRRRCSSGRSRAASPAAPSTRPASRPSPLVPTTGARARARRPVRAQPPAFRGAVVGPAAGRRGRRSWTGCAGSCRSTATRPPGGGPGPSSWRRSTPASCDCRTR